MGRNFEIITLFGGFSEAFLRGFSNAQPEEGGRGGLYPGPLMGYDGLVLMNPEYST
jgi:hypothetical protein